MTETDAPRILVVVPTYNERSTIARVVRGVLAAAPADVLVVDDSSPDGTGQVVEQLGESEPRIHVLHRGAKQGLGSAYRDGFRWGLGRGYDVLVEMDGDLSHDPQELGALLERIDAADVVVGSRYVDGGRTENWPRRRRFLSRSGNRYVQLVTGVPVRDATSGFRAFRRQVLEDLGLENLRSEGYAFQVEAVLRAWDRGYAVEEVPITFVERRSGASKISRAIVFEAVWRVLAWRVGHSRRSHRRTRSGRERVG
jgi:dolichol-phosphate mannosyltransferase